MLSELSLLVSGIVSGSMIGLLGLGIVLVYRTTRVVNFAHGAVAMAATYGYILVADGHSNQWHALLAGLAVASVCGAVIFATLQRVAEERTLARVMITVGWLTALQAFAILFITTPTRVPSIIPDEPLITGKVTVTTAQLIVVTVGLLLSLALSALLRWTAIGLRIRSVADNAMAARLAGVHVDRVLLVSWVIGAVLAGVAGILISPLTVLDPNVLPHQLFLQAVAAGVVGRFASLPVTFCAGVGIGVAMAELTTLESLGVPELLGVLRGLIPLLVVLGALYFYTARGRRFVREY